MDARALKEKIASHEEIILLDVREPEEIREAPYFVIPPKNYLNIPLDVLYILPKEELKERIFKSVELEDATPIVALCRSGGRSGRACKYLEKQGLKAENLDGGILDWGKAF